MEAISVCTIENLGRAWGHDTTLNTVSDLVQVFFFFVFCRLTQLHNLNLLQSIRCISVVLDHHTKVCTHFLVGLDNGKLIIVSVKDVPEGKI